MARDAASEVSFTRAQYRFAKTLTDILVYVVVLNLFVEFVDTVVIDSFTVSVLTAVLLWMMLGVIKALEHRVALYFKGRKGLLPKLLRYLAVWAILFTSKFVIIEVVALATAGRAALGQFFAVVAIVLVLMASEALVALVFRRLGASALQPSA